MNARYVLAALDVRSGDSKIADFAVELAALCESELVLAHVFEPQPKSVDASARAYFAETRTRGLGALEEAARRCRDVVQDVRGLELEGHPWEALVEHTDRHPPGFLVVGPHVPGREEEHMGELRRRLLGTTANQLLRHAACPVWMVPHDSSFAPGERFQRIVTAVDFSPESIRAATVSADLARRAGGRLTLVHFIPSGYRELGDQAHSWRDAFRASVRDQAEAQLDALRARLLGVEIELELRASSARVETEFLAVARDRDATAITLGSHGRKGVRRVLLGSTAEGCLRHSDVPVLIVRKS